MDTATLSSKYQILIPKTIREELDLKAGQQFTFVVKENLIQMVQQKDIRELRGILKGAEVSEIRDRRDRV
ncbi:MAG: AbrB/MazE/SpoVT family DNA-binding domain-containing protein [Myxococcaceae bacterium]